MADPVRQREAAVLEDAARHFERCATAVELTYCRKERSPEEMKRDAIYAEAWREAAKRLRTFAATEQGGGDG